jgi:hypothetical protein
VNHLKKEEPAAEVVLPEIILEEEVVNDAATLLDSVNEVPEQETSEVDVME